jgi:hypothetical protein
MVCWSQSLASDDWKFIMWSDESSFTLFPPSGGVPVWTSPKEACSPECLVPTVKHLWWFGQQYLVFCWSCTYSEWSNYCHWLRGHFRYQAHSVVQVFSKNDAIFQEGDLPRHTARSVQSWFEEHEDALQHLLWLAQLPTLNFFEPLCSRAGWEVDSLHHLSSN